MDWESVASGTSSTTQFAPIRIIVWFRYDTQKAVLEPRTRRPYHPSTASTVSIQVDACGYRCTVVLGPEEEKEASFSQLKPLTINKGSGVSPVGMLVSLAAADPDFPFFRQGVRKTCSVALIPLPVHSENQLSPSPLPAQAAEHFRSLHTHTFTFV